jgi:broad specificity phosphatase PhoE
MQVLLVRHALPLRSEHGEGSDPNLSDDGIAQIARLPEALARFPITRVVSSPQRRAIQTAEPVAAARELPVEIDDRFAEYDRDLPAYIPVEQIRAENPKEWARLVAAVADLVTSVDPDDTVAVFSHGGVINLLLHEILGTARILSFQVDYTSVTRLLYSRSGQAMVASVNTTEHVWDLLPRNQRLLDGI